MVLMLVSAFAEVVSLGAVLPFIGILVAPEQVFDYPTVADVVLALGITSADQLVLPLTVAFIAAALLAGAIPSRWNFPRRLLSLVRGRSPSKT